jgi:hypothetical protein
MFALGRSQWPRGLRRGSAAARLLELLVRIPPGPWMSVYCQIEVSASGRSLVQRSPIEYCVSECDHESSTNEGALGHWGCCAIEKKVWFWIEKMQLPLSSHAAIAWRGQILITIPIPLYQSERYASMPATDDTDKMQQLNDWNLDRQLNKQWIRDATS